MKHPLRWLIVSFALLVLTPFAVFPEIMGDIGPRNVALWRNLLALGLLGLAVSGIFVSLASLMYRRMRPTA